MYDSQTALIDNYINPIIRDMEVQALTPRVVYEGGSLVRHRKSYLTFCWRAAKTIMRQS